MSGYYVVLVSKFDVTSQTAEQMYHDYDHKLIPDGYNLLDFIDNPRMLSISELREMIGLMNVGG